MKSTRLNCAPSQRLQIFLVSLIPNTLAWIVDTYLCKAHDLSMYIYTGLTNMRYEEARVSPCCWCELQLLT